MIHTSDKLAVQRRNAATSNVKTEGNERIGHYKETRLETS